MTAFEDVALPWLWPVEGGRVTDQGGDTNLGVTQHALDAWHAQRPHRPEVPPTVAALTHPTAAIVYRDDYWDAVDGDALPVAWALVAFDTAVNSGPPVATTLLQAAVGVPVDGMLGPVTMAAVQAGSERQLEDYLWLRLDFDRAAALHQEAKGEPGLLSLPRWFKRVRDLRRLALSYFLDPGAA